MHDGLQQFLAGLSMQLEVAQGSLEMGRDAAPALQNARKLLLTLREDFRHCVNALQSTEGEMDIPAILERTSAIIRACHPVETRVVVQGSPVALPGKVVANLMLIVQEAASNAVRHGKARKIILRCDFAPEAVTVTVEDDGRGFDGDDVAASGEHFGLHNMRERASQIGGTLRIEGDCDRGTLIIASLPLPVPASSSTPPN
jgi:signal transduction histidine kinase